MADSSSSYPNSLILNTLHERFGLSGFRGQQSQVIEAVLKGRDVLALMPTGAGKSLCYQLPAVLLPGVTLVISPLLALIRDQSRRLQSIGIPCLAVSAETIRTSSSLPAQAALKRGEVKVVFASPERLQMTAFLDWLDRSLPPSGLSLIVVDEAHCITEWGRGFRPAYIDLGFFRQRYALTPVLAMTASADQWTQKDITQVLKMPADAVIRSSFNRPELFYHVGYSASPWRSVLAFLQQYHAGSAAIFYCSMRQETEQLAAFLNFKGLSARPYHAGMSYDSRQENEHWFLETQVGVMTATIAFGMGMDKPNVRLVAHVGIDHRISAYYQETGRAGRDGLPSDVLLMLRDREYYAVCGAELNDHGLPKTEREAANQAGFLHFIQSKQCRRVSLLSGLDEQFDGECHACDRCVPNHRPIPECMAHSAHWVPRTALDSFF